jgi:DNA-binding beta-propeller fold protein YncE
MVYRILVFLAVLASVAVVASGPLGSVGSSGMGGAAVAAQGLNVDLWVCNEGLISPGPPPQYRSPGELTVLNAGDRSEIARLPLVFGNLQGKRPLDLIRGGDRIYVTAQESGQVWVFDASARRVIAVVDIPSPDGVPSMPHDLELSADGRLLFVGTLGDSYVPVIDTASLRVLGVLEPGNNPTTGVKGVTHEVRLAPDQRSLFVQNHRANTITVFDVRRLREEGGFPPTPGFAIRERLLSARKPVRVVPTGVTPQHLIFNKEGTRFFLTAGGENQVEVYDFNPTTAEVTKVTEIGVGRSPTYLDIRPQGDRVYISNTGETDAAGPNISILDTRTLQIVGTISGIPKPNHIAFSAAGATFFVASGSGDFVAEVDAETNTVRGTARVGREPHGLITVSHGRF